MSLNTPTTVRIEINLLGYKKFVRFFSVTVLSLYGYDIDITPLSSTGFIDNDQIDQTTIKY